MVNLWDEMISLGVNEFILVYYQYQEYMIYINRMIDVKLILGIFNYRYTTSKSEKMLLFCFAWDFNIDFKKDYLKMFLQMSLPLYLLYSFFCWLLHEM